jgi:hypothetical protein
MGFEKFKYSGNFKFNETGLTAKVVMIQMKAALKANRSFTVITSKGSFFQGMIFARMSRHRRYIFDFLNSVIPFPE